MKNLSVLLFLILTVEVSSQNIYQYDALNRLTLATYSNGLQYQYTYDELGNRTVKAITGCLASGAAGNITGTSAVCQGSNNVAYSVPPIANATSYIWTYSGTGATINGTSNSITINFSATATSGNLNVKGSNNCGFGAVSANFPITVTAIPAVAGAITGPSTVCQGAGNVSYSVPVIPGAASYVWTLPAGVTGSGNANAIIVNYGNAATSGIISVKGHNICGDGGSSQLSVTVNQLPANNLNWPVNYDAHAVFTTGLNVPNQMVLNPAGEIYVTNHSWASYSGPYYNTIAKIDGSGNKSVFVSGYSIPTGLSIDQQQNLYFTRTNFSSAIYKVLPSGSVSTFATLPHLPGPISLYQNGTDLYFYTVSHWGSKGIYRTNSTGTPSLFNSGFYYGCQISPDGLYLYAWTADTLYRFSTATGTRENLVTNLTTYQPYPSCIGPDNKLYLVAKSVQDAAKSAIYRINGANDFTVVIDNIPGNYEENDILFKPAGVNDYDLYVCEVAGSRTSPDLNRIIRFPNIFSGAASLISGPDSVYQGQNNFSFSVEPIPHATNYIWTYSGTGATISGNSNNVIVSFATNATSGILTVKGHNNCGDGPSSMDFNVTVATGLLANQVIHNVTIPAGMDNCYDATQTITIAGNGTTFNVQSGGSVSLIAGQNIRFQTGVVVNPGGYLHGSITTANQYCFSILQPVLQVQNVNVPSGEVNCYDATQTVSVAGNGTTFIVQNGGSVSLIAGQKIRCLPGARVRSGGYLHGYITTKNEYCYLNRQPVVMVESEQPPEKQGEPELSGEKEDDWLVKVFPNPTSAILNLVVQSIETDTLIRIRIYNLLGEVVYSKELTGKNTDEIVLTNVNPGMYLLQVVQGSNIEVVKVIKK